MQKLWIFVNADINGAMAILGKVAGRVCRQADSRLSRCRPSCENEGSVKTTKLLTKPSPL